MRYLLGVDVGTSGSKGVLVDLSGRLLAEYSLEHGLDIPKPGWAEHDADAIWWGDTRKVIRALLDKSGVDPGQIAALGLSAIGPCVMAIDRSGKPLRPGILYGIDTRASAQIRRLNGELGADEIHARTGQTLSSQSAGPKILWLKENEPELFAQAHKIMSSTNYLVFKLTGRVVMDHYTAAFYDPFYNVHTLTWDEEIVRRYFDPALLPEIAWATDPAGVVNAEAAAATGLNEGIPVITGTIDAGAEAVSVGVVEPGKTMVMYGTTFMVIQVAEQLQTSTDLWTSYFCVKEKPVLVAGMSTSAALTRWYRDQFAAAERLAEQTSGENAYAQLINQAREVPPGSDGLLVLPYFSGERTPINDPDARGTILGLTLKHTGSHLFRALLEGTAFSLRHNFEAMAQLGAKPSQIVAVGGGTKNPLWLQIVSDITGTEQIVPETTIGASFGDAYMAGLGAGIFHGYDTLTGTWVQIKEVVRPNPDTTELYDYLYDIYRELYPSVKGYMRRLAVLQRGEFP